MQIAGRRCRSCNGVVALATEGKWCGRCEAAVHVDCEPAADCPVCGERFEEFERAAVDPFQDAYDPREKQSARMLGPLLAGFLAFLVGLLVFYAMTLT